MNTKPTRFTAIAVIALGNSSSFSAEPADTVFTNTTVLTMDEENPEASALAVKGTKIAFVGSAEEAEAYIGEETKVHDLMGKLVMPGFVDSHNHLVNASWILGGADLYGTQSKEEVLEKVAKWAEENPDAPFARGAGCHAQLP